MALSKKSVSGWIARIEKQKVSLGKERDQLREMIDELESLEEVCKSAYEDLESAAERLSELV